MASSTAPVTDAPVSIAPSPGVRLLDRVRLLRDVRDGEHTVPFDSAGTVVHVCQGGEGLEVEFSTPRHAVVTVRSSEVQPL